MDYFSTVAGTQFVETLNRYLPEIAEALTERPRTVQCAVMLNTEEDTKELVYAIINGELKYIGSFVSPSGKTVVITEKERR